MSNPYKLADFAASLTTAEGPELQDILEEASAKERLSKALLLISKEREMSKIQVWRAGCGMSEVCGGWGVERCGDRHQRGEEKEREETEREREEGERERGGGGGEVSPGTRQPRLRHPRPTSRVGRHSDVHSARHPPPLNSASAQPFDSTPP